MHSDRLPISMTRRLFLLIAAISVFLSGCGKTTSQDHVYIDPALYSLVPADAQVLIGANLEALRKSPVYQQHLSNEFAARLDDFARQTGLDPRKDIWEILACSNGTKTVLMSRGRFSSSELEPQLEKEGAQRTRYKTYTLFGDEKNSGVFMNSSTALAGDTAMVKAILDHRDLAPATPPILVSVKEVPHSAQFWAVFEGRTLQLPVPESSDLANVNKIFSGLQSGTFYSSFANGLDFTLAGNATNDENARQINDAIRALLGLLRLNTRNDQKELLAIYDAIDVKQTARRVQVSAHIKEDLVDQLFNSVIFGPAPSGGRGGKGATSSPQE
jgi:hypothetical protein